MTSRDEDGTLLRRFMPSHLGHGDQQQQPRSRSRMSVLRDAATPLIFRRTSTRTAEGSRYGGLIPSLLKRKRRVDEEDGEEEEPKITMATGLPIRLNFLFVGGRGSGQTSLLFAIKRTCYEVYINDFIHRESRRPGSVEM
ncbi:hypothetical protein GMORB2_4650 [Geosmithia morbida]|uniref:Uncharacterized protein n=1 Tax=Geosmithia morbida TaxID=1094350 RepID=A0A9P4YMX2_9HYPO|nr:uncharacterized protein GMORB2_4650 [Geosmithia morbida]KAF4119520.1 hypothetical protein GMORB2_4650 [Geosmithia morbida]